MRILAAADNHGSLEVSQWLIEQTPLADVLVLAGDLFDADFEDQQRLQAAEILRFYADPTIRFSTSWATMTAWHAMVVLWMRDRIRDAYTRVPEPRSLRQWTGRKQGAGPIFCAAIPWWPTSTAIFIMHSEPMVIISTLPLPPNAVRC
jgi:hypothetical protein